MRFDAYWAYEKAFMVVEISHGAYSLDYVLDEMPLAQVLAIIDYYAIFSGVKNKPADPFEAREKSIRLQLMKEIMEKNQEKPSNG